jgi:hypothetical protein
MQKLKLILIIITSIVSFNILSAQNFPDLNEYLRVPKTFCSCDDSKLLFGIENINFLKNNEYMNDRYDGYTLLGYTVKPKFTYFPSPNTKVEVGAFFLKYSGLEELSKVLPVFTFQFKIGPHLDFVMGSLYGTINHKLVEPLFQFERYYENNEESGLQFLYHHRYLESDLWVNWEKFIFLNSPYKEELTGGFSNTIKLTGEQNNWVVFIPLQALITHRGGQIDTAKTTLQTLLNTASGLNLGYKFNTGFIKYFGLENHYLTYNDLAGNAPLLHDGYAIYSNLRLSSEQFHLVLGYFQGYNFVASRGEPLFQSVSQKDTAYIKTNRQLITGKLGYDLEIYDGVKMGVRFESYYDIAEKIFDYSYSVNIVFNRDFLIGKYSASR